MAVGMLAASPQPQSANHAESARPPEHKAPTAATYFSGTVTEIKSDSITVVRKQPAKDPVTRTFAMDPKTKIEGTIREKVRVTVQFAAQADGSLRAVHVIVR